MAGTRSSARIAAKDQDTSPKQENGSAGTKRKAEPGSSPSNKRGKKATPKKQVTLEETGVTNGKEDDAPEDIEMKEAAAEGEGTDKKAGEEEGEEESIKATAKKEEGEPKEAKEESKEETKAEGEEESKEESKEETKAEGKGESKEETSKSESKPETNGDGAIEESSQRGKKMPSSIVERGIVYFFARNRVGIEEAESVGDLQRTYFALRPLPADAKLGDGAIQDLKNNRLFALPKKVLPKSHSDRFMAFVEKANASIQDLKDSFFQGSEYSTKTTGTRHQDPPATVGEGVYAITPTEDQTTHLAYMLTIPSEIGEVQEDLGLRSQGSFIISVKNPERPGPASARLPKAPEYPKEIIEEFRGLAWTQVKSKYLDYENAQILLIGENTEKAVEQSTKDKKHDKETPKEELEKLEHEDELRVQHLDGDDTVFDDLKLSKSDYPKVPTTW